MLCTILILISVYTGASNYRADLKEYGLAVTLSQKALEMQPSWVAIQNMKSTVPKPPTVLSAVAVGIQDAVGRNITLDYTRNPRPIDSKYDSNPVFAIFGPLDMTLIVKIVLSLFAVLFTFDAIAGEKEKGTLKLTLSNPVPRDQLILGKAIGSFVSFLVPLAVPVSMGLILLNIFPDISLSGEDWARVGLILLSFLLYLSVFFNLGLLVSSRTHRSSGSLFILLFIWVMLILVVPRGAVMISKQIMPVQSMHEVTAEKNTFMQQIQAREVPKAREMLMAWVRENIQDQTKPPSPEQQKEYGQLVKKANDDLLAMIDGKTAELISDYQAKCRRQQQLAFNLSRISPASALTFSALRLGKTGIEEHERFLNSIKTYRPAFSRWFNKNISENLQFGPNAEPPKPELDDMPRHRFVPEGLRDSLYMIRHDLSILILLNIILFAGSFVSFLKYDPR